MTNQLSAFSAGSKKVSWFDHFVGARQDRWRDGESERLGGLEIDDQLERGGSTTRRSASLSRVISKSPPSSESTGPSISQAKSLGTLAAWMRSPTTSQAAGVARDAEVKLLALNHLSIRYPVATLRDEAREIFANTVLPRDFDTIEIPFSERGTPELRRWSDRVAPAAVREAGPNSGGDEEHSHR